MHTWPLGIIIGERRLQWVKGEGHHMQPSCTKKKKKSSASENLQRTITQTAASAGGTLLTHRKLSWYYLCCLDLPQGFPLSSFIFPQCSFSLNVPSILPTKGRTCSWKMSWSFYLFIYWIVICIMEQCSVLSSRAIISSHAFTLFLQRWQHRALISVNSILYNCKTKTM